MGPGTAPGRRAQRAQRSLPARKEPTFPGPGSRESTRWDRRHCSSERVLEGKRGSRDGRVWKGLLWPRCREGLSGILELSPA